MTYYFIKVNYKPTDKNDRQDAKEHNYFYGKGESWVGTSNVWKMDIEDNELDDCQYNLEHNSYKRLCDARRKLKISQETDAWENNRGWWIRESSIVTVER